MLTIKNIGMDIINIQKIAGIIQRYDSCTLRYLFSANEMSYCDKTVDPIKAYSICFSGKETIGKVLKTGLAEIFWYEIEIFPEQVNCVINLTGTAKMVAEKNNITNFIMSWCEFEGNIMTFAAGQ